MLREMGAGKRPQCFRLGLEADWGQPGSAHELSKLLCVKKLVVPAAHALHAVFDNGIDERIEPWEQLIPQLDNRIYCAATYPTSVVGY